MDHTLRKICREAGLEVRYKFEGPSRRLVTLLVDVDGETIELQACVPGVLRGQSRAGRRVWGAPRRCEL